MKYTIRRMAALAALLGITGTIGAWMNGGSAFMALQVVGWSALVLTATSIRD
jgi:VIT1/CCC1 family predicted Fe2+/Mn2+ transporter